MYIHDRGRKFRSQTVKHPQYGQMQQQVVRAVREEKESKEKESVDVSRQNIKVRRS